MASQDAQWVSVNHSTQQQRQQQYAQQPKLLLWFHHSLTTHARITRRMEWDSNYQPLPGRASCWLVKSPLSWINAKGTFRRTIELYWTNLLDPLNSDLGVTGQLEPAEDYTSWRALFFSYSKFKVCKGFFVEMLNTKKNCRHPCKMIFIEVMNQYLVCRGGLVWLEEKVTKEILLASR